MWQLNLYCWPFVVLCWIITQSYGETVNVTILHYNDINSQINMYEEGYPLIPGEFGGLLKLMYLVQNNSVNVSNVLNIAAGNLVGGDNGYLGLLGWGRFGRLLHFYRPNVMGFGFNEFMAGLAQTNVYRDSYYNTSMVLISNVNCDNFSDQSEEEYFCRKVDKFRVLEFFERYRVGIVGFVSPLVQNLSEPGSLTFEDVPSSLEKVVDRELSSFKTIIAVGSGNMELARAILNQVDKIKIVVLSGDTSNLSLEDYPEQFGDRLIVRAQKFGASFGKLVVGIDTESGNVTIQEGTGLIRNNGTQSDVVPGDLVNMINEANRAKDTIVGLSLVNLEGTRSKCWKSECNLGNLVADAVVNCTQVSLNHTSYPDMIGIWTSGSIFNGEFRSGDKVSLLSVSTWLPYHDQVYKTSMTGAMLIKVFESSGTAINAPINGGNVWGQFLQVSERLRVCYWSSGHLKSVHIIHDNNSMSYLEEVKQDDTVYDVVLPSFMIHGRSVYDYLTVLFDSPDTVKIGNDTDCLAKYIEKGVIEVEIEGRITISDDDIGTTTTTESCDMETTTTTTESSEIGTTTTTESSDLESTTTDSCELVSICTTETETCDCKSNSSKSILQNTKEIVYGITFTLPLILLITNY